MKLRKPCEHDCYDPHGQLTLNTHCPGGEFLADDALIIEKVDGEWPGELVDWISEFGDPTSIQEAIESFAVHGLGPDPLEDFEEPGT